MTGSRTIGIFLLIFESIFATQIIIFLLDNIPIFIASVPISFSTQDICSSIIFKGIFKILCTPKVF